MNVFPVVGFVPRARRDVHRYRQLLRSVAARLSGRRERDHDWAMDERAGGPQRDGDFHQTRLRLSGFSRRPKCSGDRARMREEPAAAANRQPGLVLRSPRRCPNAPRGDDDGVRSLDSRWQGAHHRRQQPEGLADCGSQYRQPPPRMGAVLCGRAKTHLPPPAARRRFRPSSLHHRRPKGLLPLLRVDAGGLLGSAPGSIHAIGPSRAGPVRRSGRRPAPRCFAASGSRSWRGRKPGCHRLDAPE